MTTHAYCRVSTLDQYTENQKILINNSPYKIDHWYIEFGVSGKIPFNQREQGKYLLNNIKSGDYVIFTKIDRIGRKMLDNLIVVQEILSKNVTVIILNMGQIDNTPTGKLILNIFSAFAEFEREQMLERQKDGFARAKQQGKKFGTHLPQVKDALLITNNSIKQLNYSHFKKIMIFVDILRETNNSWHNIADKLNQLGHYKPNGSPWTWSSLRRQYIRNNM